jgi:hypothetical protein
MALHAGGKCRVVAMRHVLFCAHIADFICCVLQHVARAWLCYFALTRVCFAMRAHTFVSCGCGGGDVDGDACGNDVGRGVEWRVAQWVSAVLWRYGMCWAVHIVLI